MKDGKVFAVYIIVIQKAPTMAKLRPITERALTDPKYDIKSCDIEVKEGEQYKVAKEYFEKCSGILYFYYWNDADLKVNGFYTYPIERDDVRILDNGNYELNK